jgi:hypothetical protein
MSACTCCVGIPSAKERGSRNFKLCPKCHRHKNEAWIAQQKREKRTKHNCPGTCSSAKTCPSNHSDHPENSRPKVSSAPKGKKQRTDEDKENHRAQPIPSWTAYKKANGCDEKSMFKNHIFKNTYLLVSHRIRALHFTTMVNLAAQYLTADEKAHDARKLTPLQQLNKLKHEDKFAAQKVPIIDKLISLIFSGLDIVTIKDQGHR